MTAAQSVGTVLLLLGIAAAWVWAVVPVIDQTIDRGLALLDRHDEQRGVR